MLVGYSDLLTRLDTTAAYQLITIARVFLVFLINSASGCCGWYTWALTTCPGSPYLRYHGNLYQRYYRNPNLRYHGSPYLPYLLVLGVLTFVILGATTCEVLLFKVFLS